MQLALIAVIVALFVFLYAWGIIYFPVPVQIGIDALFILLWVKYLTMTVREHGAKSLDTLFAAFLFACFVFGVVFYYCAVVPLIQTS